MSSPADAAAQRTATTGHKGQAVSATGSVPSRTSDVQVVSDEYWVPDVEHMDAARRQKPWRTDVNFFTSVSVSLSATVKMFMHGTRGCPDMSQGRFNWFEVMGLLIGHFRGHELVLTDSFSLPVAASEVECSMTEASQIYMANYLEYHRRLGKAEPGCVGWYHTHPGYSCFLSGIDVTTQQGSQRMQDPWVALVIDPVETLRTGEFSMKAFRTYPEGYTPPEAASNTSAAARGGARDTSSSSPPSILGAGGDDGNFGLPPSNRVKDFGIHAHCYYELPVKVVQSRRDAPLWAMLQQHFWPLSLSLSFPFAATTRTCQCCPAQLAALTAALAVLTDDSRKGGRAVRRTRLLDAPQQDGRYKQKNLPLLYRGKESAAGEDGVVISLNKDFDADEEAAQRAAVEQRLLALARDALQAKSEAFSLPDSTQPVHTELLQALRVLSIPTKTSSPRGKR